MSKQKKDGNEVDDAIDLFMPSFNESIGYPDENQYITSHVHRQARESRLRHRDEYLQGDRGLEPLIVLEGKDIRVFKRIFHPGHAEKLTGADFVITKKKNHRTSRVAVQVKRNVGRRYFEFRKRDLEQLRRFGLFSPSGYYLFVNETTKPPTECFVMVSEVRQLLSNTSRSKNPKIANAEVAKFCRGSQPFYKAFYNCRRGSQISEVRFIDKAIEYVKKTRRVIVELLWKK